MYVFLPCKKLLRLDLEDTLIYLLHFKQFYGLKVESLIDLLANLFRQ